MSTEQFRALAAVCLMAVTVCCVVAAFQLNGMKVAQQRQACAMHDPASMSLGPDVYYTGYVAESLDCERLMLGNYPSE